MEKLPQSVGNAEEARFIHQWVRSMVGEGFAPSRGVTDNPPEGWDFLGVGSFRSTWRSPTGVAYKVQHSSESHQGNELEYRVAVRLMSAEPLEGVRFPACSLFPVIDGEDVIAMECVKGVTLCEFDHWSRGDLYGRMYSAESHYGLRDIHDENVMVEVDTGTLVIVDLAG